MGLLFIDFILLGVNFLDPTVKFLIEHLENAGCFVEKKFIKAVECDKKISGGYVRGEGVYTCLLLLLMISIHIVFVTKFLCWLSTYMTQAFSSIWGWDRLL